MVDHC